MFKKLGRGLAALVFVGGLALGGGLVMTSGCSSSSSGGTGGASGSDGGGTGGSGSGGSGAAAAVDADGGAGGSATGGSSGDAKADTTTDHRPTPGRLTRQRTRRRRIRRPTPRPTRRRIRRPTRRTQRQAESAPLTSVSPGGGQGSGSAILTKSSRCRLPIPSPVCGRGQGEGRCGRRRAPALPLARFPLSLPSPRTWGGDRTHPCAGGFCGIAGSRRRSRQFGRACVAWTTRERRDGEALTTVSPVARILASSASSMICVPSLRAASSLALPTSAPATRMSVLLPTLATNWPPAASISAWISLRGRDSLPVTHTFLPASTPVVATRATGSVGETPRSRRRASSARVVGIAHERAHRLGDHRADAVDGRDLGRQLLRRPRSPPRPAARRTSRSARRRRAPRPRRRAGCRGR